MKRVMATLLCLVMAFGILSGCSTANTENKPTESTTVESSTEESTSAPEDQPTESATDETQSNEEVIIPLFPEESNDQIHQLSYEELMKYGNFTSLFNPYDTEIIYTPLEGGGQNLYTTEYINRSFELASSQNAGTAVEITFWLVGPYYNMPGVEEEDYNFAVVYFEASTGVQDQSTNCILLYYNQAKKCLVAYKRIEGQWQLVEIYWKDSENFITFEPIEDASIYGF